MKKQKIPAIRAKARKKEPAPVNSLRPEFYKAVANLLRNARQNVYRAVNFAMVEAYWNVGRMIVEEEQKGKERAEYGAVLLKELARHLTKEFGRGFDETNLRKMRQFYLAYPIYHAARDILGTGQKSKIGSSETVETFPICDALRHKFSSDQIPQLKSSEPVESFSIRDALRLELSWTHYRLLMRVEKPEARTWYMNEAADQNWSTRALERQINSLYYERLLMSRNKMPVEAEALEKTSDLSAQPEDFIKDPYVLEFLGIPDAHPFRESDLEQAIIGKLQKFMLELGKGFAFVARQYRVSTETADFFVDLVFYNYLLKCFVLIDLKTGMLTHQDIGQMDMYVRLFEDKVKAADDNPTVGLILCTEKDQTVVKYSVLNENRQLFASKYQLYLPTEEELRKELERERALVLREQEVRYG